MKKYISLILGIILMASCEPDVANEGINLPQIDLPFNIDKDTAYIKLGDTLKVSAIVSSILSDGTKITDGKASIDIGCGYSPESPIIDSETQRTAKKSIDFEIFNNEGIVIFNENSMNLKEIHLYADGSDSLRVAFYFVPFKKGTYSFHLASLFFEGSQGKTRTNPFFNIQNNNGTELWQVPNMPALQPNDPAYNKHYYFAVTD